MFFFTNHIAWWEKAVHFSRFYTGYFGKSFDQVEVETV